MQRNFINLKARGLRQGAIRAMSDKAAAMDNVISMGIGEPDMTTPEIVCRLGKEALDKGYTHYSPNAGLMMARKAVAEKSYLKGLGYDPAKEIIMTNGGMGALSLLMLVLLDEGDEVLIQDPQWLNYAAQIEYCGGKAVRVPTDSAHNFELRPEILEAHISSRTKAVILNSPNNPTGAVMSPASMQAMADLAKKHDILVISDEVYGTLVYDGIESCTIAALGGMKERTVIVNSFSKSYAMTGWRVGYAAGPAFIIDRMTKCQENFNACASVPGQYAAAMALDHPECAAQLREIFARRRSLILGRLSSIGGIRFNVPQGAFYVFPDISSFGLSSEEFCDRLLEEEHVVCIPGSAFGACGEGFIRISYACSDESIQEAMDRIERFCKRLGQRI